MDPTTQRIAIVTMGVIALAAIGGCLYITAIGREVPAPLVALAGVVVGSIATLILPTQRIVHEASVHHPHDHIPPAPGQ